MCKVNEKLNFSYYFFVIWKWVDQETYHVSRDILASKADLNITKLDFMLSFPNIEFNKRRLEGSDFLDPRLYSICPPNNHNSSQ